MKHISYLIICFFFLLFIGLIGLIPFRVMYIVSDALAWMLRVVFRYRLDVVRKNLEITGVTGDPNQSNKLVRDIYKNLSDILLEGFKSFTMSRKSVVKRHKVLNPELVNDFYKNGQSIILVTGHIGNWEWGSLSAGLQCDYPIVGFYKPLKNKYINKFVRWSRARSGTYLAPIKETSLTFETFRNTPSMYLMAADQNPSKETQVHWCKFFNRDTAFLHGPARHAINNQFPVVFADISRVKRGRYELVISILVDKPQLHKAEEITQLYASKLEQIITSRPSSWLWTHKRWKREKPTADQPSN